MKVIVFRILSIFLCCIVSLGGLNVHGAGATEIQAVLDTVTSSPLVLSADGETLLLPDTGNPEYGVRVAGCSNTAVIHEDRTVTKPLNNMTANVFLEVYEKANEENKLFSDTPNIIMIEGEPEIPLANAKPEVFPGIREWQGFAGQFVFGGNIKIENNELRETADIVAMYIREMSGAETSVSLGAPVSGDIYLKVGGTSFVGEEGYELSIEDVATITAPTHKGYVYAGATISQIIRNSEDKRSMPRGRMRDYPQYPVRAVMLDVGRMYLPIDYVEEMTKYASFYKINEMHMHINDNGGEQSGAFRVESKKYPAINQGIITYSQQEYKDFQNAVKPFGIDVVTEIDTPAHSVSIGFARPDIMLNASYIDVKNPDALVFIKSLFDEFLDGDDPVFKSQKFHIGTDEYPKAESEAVRKYMDELIAHVNSKGLQAAAWSSLGSNGFAGVTPVRDHISHYWSSMLASFDEMLEDGYKFVNNNAMRLYVVPGGLSTSFKDRLNMSQLYDWDVSITPTAPHLKAGHPQMLGAEAALWNDLKVGMSEFDIFDRFRDQIHLISEKTWYGEKTAGQTAAMFVERVENLPKTTPSVNPARFVTSAAPLVARYDFEGTTGTTVPDLSQNGYDAVLNGVSVFEANGNKALKLNGQGWLSLPFDSMGYPYTLYFDMTVSKATPSNAVVFTGKDGTLIYDFEGTGQLAYQRNGYTFLLDYEVVGDLPQTYTIVCDRDELKLYVDGYMESVGTFHEDTVARAQKSSTFVLPTEKIGSGIKGNLDNISLYNYAFSDAEVTGISHNIEYMNLARDKEVLVSGIEGGYKPDGTPVYPQFDPSHAVDGLMNTNTSLDRLTETPWLIVDLGKEYTVDKVKIVFQNTPEGYEVYTSTDEVNWDLVRSESDLPSGGFASECIVDFPGGKNLRYMKFQQTKRFLNAQGTYRYSANMREIEIYGHDTGEVHQIVEQAKAALETVSETPQNKAFRDTFSERISLLESFVSAGNFSDMVVLAAFVSLNTQTLIEGSAPSFSADFSTLGSLLNEDLKEERFVAQGWEDYDASIKKGKYTFFDASSSQDDISLAVERINRSRNKLRLKNLVSISTNKTIHGDNPLQNLIDGDPHSIAWLRLNQTIGDYILFEFRDAFALSSVTLKAPGGGGDILGKGEIQISENGESWATVGEVGTSTDETIEFNAQTAKYVKILVTENKGAWWKLGEVNFNNKVATDIGALEFETGKAVPREYYTAKSLAFYDSAVYNANQLMGQEDVLPSDVNAMVDQVIAARNALSL